MKNKMTKNEKKLLAIISRLRGISYHALMTLGYKNKSKVENEIADNGLELLKKRKYGAGLKFEK